MQIDVNGNPVVIDYNSALPKTASGTLKQFKTERVCKVRISYSGPAYPISVYGPDVLSSKVYYLPAAGNA